MPALRGVALVKMGVALWGDFQMHENVKSFLFRILCGFFLGVSVLAPGVSGSVMAVMMGIYRNLVDIISNPLKNLKQNIFYLLPMGIGAVLSLFLTINLLAFAFDRYPTQSYVLFMGLIAGSLAEIWRQARKVSFKRHYITGIIAAFAIALAMSLLQADNSAVVVNHSLWYLCLTGGIAGIVSIIPGMSVSLILMLFGVYDYLLQTAASAMTNLLGAAAIAIPVGICFLVGLIIFSNVIKLLFDRYPGFAYFMVFGFMCGTLFAVFPSALPQTAGGWLTCALMFIAGLGVSTGFQLLGKKYNAG